MTTPGERFGNYELVSLLGRGGMGEVWRARHALLERPAAVKLVRPDTLNRDPGNADVLWRRFAREAQATASLRSPHAVELYDFGLRDDGTFYYVMELLEGSSLQVLVQRFGAVAPARAVHFLKQACDGLAEAHRLGLVHRDVKPGNLFACRFGPRFDHLKILDFGLVAWKRAADEIQLTHQGTAPGSPAFMAPEAARGEPLDARADLYALGCVAYHLLTGRLPFAGKSTVEVLMAHATQAPTPPTQIVPTIPSALERIVLACLEKDRAARPASALELKARFAELGTSWTDTQAEAWWRQAGGLADPIPGTFAQATAVDARDGRNPGALGADPPSADPPGHDEARRGDAAGAPADPGPRPIDTFAALRDSSVPEGRLTDLRQWTRSALQHHFTASRIDLDEFERRLALARHADSEAQLRALLSDLPEAKALVPPAAAVAAPDPRNVPSRTPEPIVERPGRASAALVPHSGRVSTQVGIFGSASRKGAWNPDDRLVSVAVFGSVELDFSEVAFPPGVTEVKAVSVCGSVELVIPPNVRLEAQGIGVLGSFEHTAVDTASLPDDAPVLRITGVAVLGSVEIQVAARGLLGAGSSEPKALPGRSRDPRRRR